MAEFYSQLPQDAKQAAQYAQSTAKIHEIRQLCENVEVETANHKLTELQIQAYHFQLLVYLILDELPLAKYLFKRVPKECRSKDSFGAIWDIGCLMWKNDHSGVYKKIQSGKFSPIHKPFIGRLEVNYRLKQVELVTKSYTSITIKELLNEYLGLKDLKDLALFIKKNKLSDMWIYDNPSKPTIINIQQRKTDYSNLLNAKMLNNFTKYVVFMESQQKLTIDEIASANSSKN